MSHRLHIAISPKLGVLVALLALGTLVASSQPPAAAKLGKPQPAARATTTPSADLATTMSPTRGFTYYGSPVNFTATVTNNGPAAAQNLVVTDNFSVATFRNVSWSVPSGAASCTHPPFGGHGTITCTTGALQPGQAMSIIVGLTARCFPNQLMGNSATATSSTNDPDPSNNTAGGELKCN
jgi:large repetitive protein